MSFSKAFIYLRLAGLIENRIDQINNLQKLCKVSIFNRDVIYPLSFMASVNFEDPNDLKGTANKIDILLKSSTK
jgi:hypothetical protein